VGFRLWETRVNSWPLEAAAAESEIFPNPRAKSQEPDAQSPIFLASRRKPAGSSHGQSKILVRIYRSVVDADFVVKMWAGAATADADVSNDVAAMYVLADSDCEV
jgi:hypothetical protein